MTARRRNFKDRLTKTTSDEDQATRERLKHMEARFRAAERFNTETPSAEQAVIPEQATELKVERPRRPLREAFALPSEDHEILQTLIERGEPVRANKSEVIRAALRFLAELPDDALIERLSSIERRKPGRPVKHR